MSHSENAEVEASGPATAFTPVERDCSRDPRDPPKALPAALAGAATLLGAANPMQAQTVNVPPGTGSPGPGVFRGGLPDFDLTGVSGNETFDTFGCKVWKGSPPTPDWQQATVYFERKFYENDSFRLPTGGTIAVWGFEDTLRAPGVMNFPSPLIRVTEGDMVHTKLDQRKGTHTIHHHGIEPTTMNDGVGHVSFEVEETYIYQWQPRHPGTWFYHCHKNTPLHFEYGMYGLLIVDPALQPDGKKRAFRPYVGLDPVYDVEAFWVADDMDPRWHTLHQEAGLCAEDAGLNIFRPRYFFITGIPNTQTTTSPSVAVNARQGQKILIRLLNASYSVLAVTFPVPVKIISVDGHSLGGAERPWNRPIDIPAGQAIQVATATRYDVYIDTAALGLNPSQTYTYTTNFEFQDWVTRKVHNQTSALVNRGTAQTTITVRPA